MSPIRRTILLALLAVSGDALAYTGPAPAWYHDHTAIGARLQSLATSHAQLATLRSIGKSFEGRDLWLFTLGASRPSKPAALLIAGDDGRELTASEVALATIEHLLESLPPESLIDTLDRTTLHVLVRANPDGAERGFGGSGAIGAIPRPEDEDHDERIDEDGPDDVNGDDLVTWMRVRDPAGTWTADPADERLLVERKSEDEGPFYRRYREGLDDDGDGLVNEDGEGGAWLLHNFPQGWEMTRFQSGAGRYAASELETRAILELMIAHPEIALVLSLSQHDRPERPGVASKDAVPDDDAEAYEAIDAWVKALRGHGLDTDHESEGETAMGGTGQLIGPPAANAAGPRGPRAIVPGRFADWAYFQGGAFTIAPQIWVAPPAPADTTGGAPTDSSATRDGTDDASGADEDNVEGDDADEEKVEPRDENAFAWLEHIDRQGAGFVPWTPFDHPTLGPVEIGGFAPSPRYHADEAPLDSLGAETASLLLSLCDRLGRVAIRSLESTGAGDGLFRVALTVENTGELPTLSARGASTKLLHEALCEIGLSTGASLVDTPERVHLGRLSPGERRTVEWLVAGAAGAPVDVRVFTVRAGDDARSITLSP